MGGASQGFSAPEAAGPPALADPQPWAGRQLVPRGPFSILLCQRRRNSQPCRQPSVHRGEQTKRGPHTTEQYSASKRKEVPTRLPQHGRSFTIMLRLKEARHKTAEAIQFRFHTRVSVPLCVVPSPTGLPSKRGPGLVQNWERSTSMLYIITLPI